MSRAADLYATLACNNEIRLPLFIFKGLIITPFIPSFFHYQTFVSTGLTAGQSGGQLFNLDNDSLNAGLHGFNT